MKKKGISQEGLKLIACVTMLLDHIGATLVLRYLQSAPGANPEIVNLYYVLRIIGRIAFPIYCFLLVEGAHHTRNSEKYALRLAIGAVLAEIPFDLAFSSFDSVFDGTNNSVMVTLLLGFLMIECMKWANGFWKVAVILPFYIMAEVMCTDYAGLGIALIAMLYLTRGVKHEKLLRTVGSMLILCTGMKNMQIFGIWINIESFAIFSLIPIFCYDGRKLTHNKVAQWAFYLFYPVHLLMLAGLEMLIFG